MQQSDVCSTFVSFYNFILNHFNVSNKTLQSEGEVNTQEKLSKPFGQIKELAIICPVFIQWKAEMKHREIIEITITLLQTASISPLFFYFFLWSFACQTFVYLINRMPTSTLHHKSLFEVLFKSVPEIQHLRVLGCLCFPLLRPYNNTKLQTKTTKCVFLRGASKFKGYVCYKVSKKRVCISIHVLFDEFEFPYLTLVN